MKKRLMAKILLVLLIVSLFTANGGAKLQVAQAASNYNECEVDGIVWRYITGVNGDVAIHVSPSDRTIIAKNSTKTSLIIPESLDGKKVISIDDYAFQGCTSLVSVTIPEGVASIGTMAFDSCENLTSITIPKGLTYMSYDTFSRCKSLKEILVSKDNQKYESVNGVLYNKGKTEILRYPSGKEGETYTISEGVTSIGREAFCECKNLKSISIPNGVIRIGEWAFRKCTNLTNINIPIGVTSIGRSAFYECENLASIIIPEGVTSIEELTFIRCKKLTDIIIPKGVKVIGESAFAGCVNLSSVTILEGVTTIGKSAFSSCTSLSSIIMPESVTSIQDEAFGSCNSLLSIRISKGVTTIGEGAFASKNLREILVSEENQEYESVEGVLYNKEKTEIRGYPNGKEGENYTIIEGVTSIGNYAFSHCSNIKSITIPRGVTRIGDEAFSYCRSLTSITIPEGLTSIGYEAFYFCEGLKSIIIPKGVKSIGSSAFCFCGGLESITIQEGVESIEKDTFFDCEMLKNVTLPESLVSIEDSAFAGCYSLTSITIPEGVTSIGGAAFNYCEMLSSIIIPQKVTKIGEGAFSNCGNLTSVTIPDGVTKIEYGAFYQCDSLTSITIPKGVTSIGESAFSGCKSLISIIIPEGVTSIGECAFSECESLTSIIIPKNVTSIAKATFSYCKKLTNIIIPEGVTSIGSGVFYQCQSLPSITIPQTVTSIGDQAFSGCIGLTNITIPEGVTRIEDNTFNSCTSLQRISVPGSISFISDSALSNCGNNLITIYAEIDSYASNFNWGSNRTIDTTIGTKDEAKRKLLVAENTLLNYIKQGGLVTDDLYKNIKVAMSTYSTTKLIDAETDMPKLKFWIVNLDGKIKAADFTISSFTTDIKSPQALGSKIKLSALGSGGLGALEYRFKIYSGTELIFTKDYSTQVDAIWTPSKIGTYTLCASIKDTTGRVVEKSITYVIGNPLSISSFNVDVLSPQLIGSSIKFNATGTGIGVLQYEFCAKIGSVGHYFKSFSEENNAVWIPKEAGTYEMIVSLKDETGKVIEKSFNYTIASPLYFISVTPDLVSPQIAGTGITLATSTSGGAGTLQTKYDVYDGVSWTVLKNYSTEGKVVWNPTKAGNYKINATVKDETGKERVKSLDYIINNAPLKISEFTANMVSPQTVGTGITLTTKSSGGIGTVQTRFTIYDGSKWEIIKDYSLQGNTVWIPTKAGTYKVYTDIKDATGKVVTKTLDYVINPAITINSFTTSAVSPQELGKEITLSSTANGGTGILQTRFTIFDGLKWEIIKDYSLQGNTVWTPTKAGSYTVYADVKDITGKIVTKKLTYVINKTLSVDIFTTNIASPQTLGTGVTLSATGTGEGTLKYKFIEVNGTTTTVLKESSETNTVVWTPIKEGTYTIKVQITDSTGKVVEKILTYVITTPLTISNFTTNVASPQTVGTGITLTTKTSGGTGIAQTKYAVYDGKTWTVIKNYSTEGTVIWKPTKAGSYKISVSVKDDKGEIVSKSMTYVITTPLTISNLTANVASPQTVGTGITLTTKTSGGTGIAQTKYAVYDGKTWTVIKNYSIEGTVIWKPTKAGSYKISVSVKDDKGEIVSKSITYVITTPLTISNFTTNVTSPQTVGTGITLTTKTSGGTGTVQTKYAVYDGKTWTVIKDYSTEGTVIWKPTKAGNYKISVSVKDGKGKIVSKSITYLITTPLTISNFTTNVTSPQTVGTGITLTTKTSGGTGTVQTKYAVYDGKTWTVIKDYSTEGTVIWKPTKAGNYKISVSVKDGKGKIVSKSMTYVITTPLTISNITAK